MAFRGSAGRVTVWLLGRTLCVALALAIAAPALAASTARKNNRTTGAYAAPTVEDGADYFAQSRRNVSLADQKKADELRVKSMETIDKLLLDKRIGARKFELLLRLGELHVERHDYLRETEMTDYATAYAKWEDAGKPKSREPVLNTERSRLELTKAANAFRSLVTEFPKHPAADAPLFALGRALTRLDNENSVLYFDQLVKYHPNSRFIPESYLAMGEFWFDRHDMVKALANYEKAMKTGKETRIYPYAVYKLGWAYYNAPARNDTDRAESLKKAVTAFKLVVKLADRDKDKIGNVNLRQEAVNDLIMVWAETEDVDGAWAYFQTVNQEESFYKMLERLGWIYSEAGKTDKAIATYTRLLKAAPTRVNNPEIHAKIASLREASGDVDGVVKDLRAMRGAYMGETPWVVANKTTPGVVRDASEMIEKSVHRYGAMFHQRGQKMKSNRELLTAASTLYRVYLEAFPQNANAYEIRYYLADILFEFREFDPAADEYTTVALARPKDGKYLKESARNAVVCLNTIVHEAKYPKLPPPGQVAKAMEIPATKAKLVRMIDNFAKLLPKDAEGYPMRYTAASVFFDYGQYPEAIKRFDAIITDIPKSKQAENSAKMILGYYLEREDFASLVEWSRKFLKSQDLMATAGLRGHVEQVLRDGVFRRAMAIERDKKYAEAAEAFVAFQREFPKDMNADRALYNATLNYYKAGKIDEALAWGGKLMEEYPKSASRPDLLATLGESHEAIGQFDKAAYYYRAMAYDYPRDKRAQGALYNAAVLNKGINKNDAAIVLFKEYVVRYPTDKLAKDALLATASLEDKVGRYADSVATYRMIGQRATAEELDDALFAEARVAEITAARLNPTQGMKALEGLAIKLASIKDKPAYEARKIVASSLFRQADTLVPAFKEMRVSDAARIEAQVEAKQARLEQVANAFERVVEIGNGEYTVASLYRLGEMSEDFAQTLFKAPAPKGASQEEIDQYRSSIEKVAFPLKQDAHKFFEEALKRSREVETFSVWTQRAYQKMAELEPAKYPEIREMPADPSYMSHRVGKDPVVEKLAK